MKRISSFIIFFVFALTMLGQTYSDKVTGITFYYPSGFKKIPIEHAPHMKVKLGTQSHILSLSVKSSVELDNVWEGFEMIKESNVNGLVEAKKINLKINGNTIKSVRTIYDYKQNGFIIYTVSYHIIHRNRYVLVCIAGDRRETSYYDNLMLNLKLD